MRAVILILATLACVSARRLPRHAIFGLCYDVDTPASLDLKKWTTGKWYEVERYENEFEMGSDCSTQTYFLDESSGQMDVSFSLRMGNGSIGLLQGSVNYTTQNNTFDLKVTFPHDSAVSSLDVLSTDIENYAIVYSCWQKSNDTFLPEKQERLWVLSRTATLSNETATIVDAALQLTGGIDLGRYTDPVLHDNCP